LKRSGLLDEFLVRRVLAFRQVGNGHVHAMPSPVASVRQVVPLSTEDNGFEPRGLERVRSRAEVADRAGEQQAPGSLF